MESAGLQIDHYTVASLLKALKRAPSGKGDLQRVLDLIDRSRINVFCEEVLLNAALDACMKHGEHHRLENLLDNRIGHIHICKPHQSLQHAQECSSLLGVLDGDDRVTRRRTN